MNSRRGYERFNRFSGKFRARRVEMYCKRVRWGCRRKGVQMWVLSNRWWAIATEGDDETKGCEV